MSSTRSIAPTVVLFYVTSLAACSQDRLSDIATKTDEFSQNVAAAIDVLWVIDNSESMHEEQQGLGESFQVFIDHLSKSNVDYHIGVISTDPHDGGLLHGSPAFIDRDTNDPARVFLNNVRVGTNGTRDERGFQTAALALGKGPGWRPGQTATPPNAGFLRDDASLFIIMVSDEEDNSFGPIDYYGRLFESYKGPGNEARVSVSAVVGPATVREIRGGCFDPARGNAAPGNRYVELANQTGGVFASICSDFNEATATLSITAAELKAIFPLASLPNTESNVRCDDLARGPFCVRVNDKALAENNDRTGYTYEPMQNAIVFGTDAIPPPEARILVEYRELN